MDVAWATNKEKTHREVKMKICFPVIEEEGLKSKVNDHFGSTEIFLIYDTDTKTHSTVKNADAGHEHGACQPLKALSGQHVDAVVLGGIGRGALMKLNALGVKVLRTKSLLVEENIELFNNGKLAEITPEETCAGHGDCGHGH